jgi:lysophospholipase L1-like esterase
VLTDLNNQTLRMIVHTSIGGETVRIRLANAFGAATAVVGAAHIGVRAKDSSIVPASDRTLTFSGKPSATMYAGQELVSDPVNLTVVPLSDLAVSIYFSGDTGAPTNHPTGLHPAYVSKEGDFTAASEIADPAMVTQSYYWLQGVDVLAPADAAAVVTFGDSITDGARSTSDTNSMWPAVLAARLQADKSTARFAVVNAGISGNRILGDNAGGVVRLSRDALDVPGVKWIILLEGINDISFAMRQSSSTFSADDLIAAYRQVIEAAHLRGIKVIGCTMTPYGGSGGYKDAGEAIREAANNWTRTGGQFDAVVDFEAATRDSADPKRFRAEAASPDMLHPGDAGYKLMADAINLAIFSARPAGKSSEASNAH